MKGILVLFVLTALSLSAKSQTKFDIFAGPQATTASYSIAGIKQPTQSKFGFLAGFGCKIPFESHLFFSPAAFYSLKGYKVQFNRYTFPPDTTAVDNNTTIHTFELAFLLQFDFGKQPSHVFLKLGPSLDFQLIGKERFNLKAGGTVDQSMNYDFTAYGHYSANMLLQLGYEMAGGFTIAGQYTLGLANLSNADNGPTIKHRAYGITVGKYFNKK